MNNLPEELAKIVKEVDEQIAGRLHEIENRLFTTRPRFWKPSWTTRSLNLT